MPKNTSAIVSGMGVGMGFITALMEEIQGRGGIDDDIHRLVKPEGRKTIGQIADLIIQSGRNIVSRVVSSFAITCEGNLKASELVKAGKYDWSNDLITDKRFPLQPHAPVARKIGLVECDFDPSSEEALGEHQRHGLKRPTAEDALEFGKEYPEEQRKRPVVFLHEPVLGPDGDRGVLVLDEDAGGRSLFLYWFGSRWRRSFVFAGVRE